MAKVLKFGDCAELRSEKVNPSESKNSIYVGLEHIEQQTLALSGHGFGADVDSQKQKFQKGDILFGKLRPYFRKVIIAPFDGICSTDIWVVRPKGGFDSNFLFYWMASEEFINSSTHAAEGGRMPRAKWDWVSEFEIEDYGPEHRKNVGETLSLFDEKIAANKEVVSSLESIAKALFESLAADFISAATPADSESGGGNVGVDVVPDALLATDRFVPPRGWQIGKFGDLSGLQGGYSFKSSSWKESGIPVIKIGSVKPGWVDLSKVSYVDVETAENTKDIYRLSRGSLVIGLTGYVGEVGLVRANCPEPLLNQRVAKFVAAKGNFNLPFVYCLARSRAFRSKVEELANGSAQQNVSIGQILDISIFIPPKDVLSEFQNSLESTFDQMLNLVEQNHVLAQIRDGLLPRLISGAIPIPENGRG